MSAVTKNGVQADLPDRRKMDRDALRRFRDDLICKVRGELTVDEVAYIFNRHPVHIHRIVKGMPAAAKERVHAITSPLD
jgi:hypothetical protein